MLSKMARLLVWTALLIVAMAATSVSSSASDLPQLVITPWRDNWGALIGEALLLPTSWNLPFKFPTVSQPLNINSLPPISGGSGEGFSFDDVRWDALDIQSIELLVTVRNSSQFFREWNPNTLEFEIKIWNGCEELHANPLYSVKTQPTAFSVTQDVMGTSVTCHGKMVVVVPNVVVTASLDSKGEFLIDVSLAGATTSVTFDTTVCAIAAALSSSMVASVEGAISDAIASPSTAAMINAKAKSLVASISSQSVNASLINSTLDFFTTLLPADAKEDLIGGINSLKSMTFPDDVIKAARSVMSPFALFFVDGALTAEGQVDYVNEVWSAVQNVFNSSDAPYSVAKVSHLLFGDDNLIRRFYARMSNNVTVEGVIDLAVQDGISTIVAEVVGVALLFLEDQAPGLSFANLRSQFSSADLRGSFNVTAPQLALTFLQRIEAWTSTHVRNETIKLLVNDTFTWARSVVLESDSIVDNILLLPDILSNVASIVRAMNLNMNHSSSGLVNATNCIANNLVNGTYPVGLARTSDSALQLFTNSSVAASIIVGPPISAFSDHPHSYRMQRTGDLVDYYFTIPRVVLSAEIRSLTFLTWNAGLLASSLQMSPASSFITTGMSIKFPMNWWNTPLTSQGASLIQYFSDVVYDNINRCVPSTLVAAFHAVRDNYQATHNNNNNNNNNTTSNNGTAGNNGTTGNNGTNGNNGTTGNNGTSGNNGTTGNNNSTGNNATVCPFRCPDSTCAANLAACSCVLNAGLYNVSAAFVREVTAFDVTNDLTATGFGVYRVLVGNCSGYDFTPNLRYTWALINAGSNASLFAANGSALTVPRLTLQPDATYTLTLTVRGLLGNTVSVSWTVTTVAPTPVVSITKGGAALRVSNGNATTIAASVTDSFPGESPSFSWTCANVTAAACPSLANATIARLVLPAGSVTGTFTITFTYKAVTSSVNVTIVEGAIPAVRILQTSVPVVAVPALYLRSQAVFLTSAVTNYAGNVSYLWTVNGAAMSVARSLAANASDLITSTKEQLSAATPTLNTIVLRVSAVGDASVFGEAVLNIVVAPAYSLTLTVQKAGDAGAAAATGLADDLRLTLASDLGSPAPYGLAATYAFTFVADAKRPLHAVPTSDAAVFTAQAPMPYSTASSGAVAVAFQAQLLLGGIVAASSAVVTFSIVKPDVAAAAASQIAQAAAITDPTAAVAAVFFFEQRGGDVQHREAGRCGGGRVADRAGGTTPGFMSGRLITN
ncbi:collagen, putative [Bodo saltans]|uniref:Collagen, putative n=1 Tax=Bodo saltans TaxID=75058 RepID=A0A0S4KFN4_BODSA|nr:collagen, putative [Bodo saltans]|eukprot:CUI10778.1 collagen, putative [Bodo saltans]